MHLTESKSGSRQQTQQFGRRMQRRGAETLHACLEVVMVCPARAGSVCTCEGEARRGSLPCVHQYLMEGEQSKWKQTLLGGAQ